MAGLKYPPADSNWPGNLLYFAFFQPVFARLLVNELGNGRRLVHKITNNGFEMLEKARFFVWCTCEFVCLLFRSSLWNISYQRFFQVSKKSARHSQDILVVSWNVEMGRACDDLWQNDRLLRGILFTEPLFSLNIPPSARFFLVLTDYSGTSI